jgi:hypothetical protein
MVPLAQNCSSCTMGSVCCTYPGMASIIICVEGNTCPE